MPTEHDTQGRPVAAPETQKGSVPTKDAPERNPGQGAPSRHGRVFLLHLDALSSNECQTLAVAQSLLSEGGEAAIVCRASSRLAAEARMRNLPLICLADDAAGGLGTAWTLLRALKDHGGKDLRSALLHACDPAASSLASRVWRLGKKLRILHTRRVPVMESNPRAMRCYQVPPAKVVTDSLASKIALRLSGLEPHLLHTIPCGLDPAACPRRQDRQDGRFIFAITGELAPRRGHAELFDAMAQVTPGSLPIPWEVRVLGSGPLFAALLAEAETKNVARHLSIFTGLDPAKEMRHCDALVLPAPEGESYIPRILEGWAANLPLVTANRLDHAEILEDGVNCLLAQPGNAQHLAACMARVATQPDLCARLVAGGQTSLAKFSLATMTAAYRRLYRECLA